MGTEKKIQFDDLDWKLLKALRQNPRASVRELATQLSVHRNTITNRLTRENTEDLIHHHILPNYDRLGVITAFILATGNPTKADLNQKDTAEEISRLAGVEEVSVISGNWDYIIKIRAQSMIQIGETIIEELRSRFVFTTITCISFWAFSGERPFDLIRDPHTDHEPPTEV